MIDVKITNNYPFAVSVGYEFVGMDGRNDVQPIGTVPAHQTVLFNKAIPRNTAYQLEVRNSTGQVISTVRGPGHTPDNSVLDSTWMVRIGP